MFALRCLSCEHDNAVGVKFCAECGSPLNLKLCKHCEAINERTAQRCHKCGTEFPGQSMADEAGGAEAAGGPDVRANVPSLVQSPSKRSAAGRVRTSRTMLSALLLAAIASLAYYLYRQPTVGPSAIDVVRSALKATPGSTPTPSVAVTAGAGAADASSADSATSALPVSRSQQPVTHTKRAVAAPIASTPDVKQAAPVTAGAAAADASSADSATSALPVSRSQQPVTHTKRAVTAPITPTPDVKQAAPVTAGAAAAEASTPEVKETAVAPQATMDPSAAAQPSGSESRVDVRQDQPGSGICTEVAVALGLCSPKAQGEGK